MKFSTNHVRAFLLLKNNSFAQRRCFFHLPFQSTTKKFTDQKLVKLSSLQLYNVVENVDDYRDFVPNCIDSNVLYRSAKRMEAELIVGIPNLLTEKYISVITLDKPNRILVQTNNSKVLRYLESEWKFETVKLNRSNQTLVTFRVEFEFYSKLHSSVMNIFFDDLTRKTMLAFINRAQLINSNQHLLLHDQNEIS